MFEFQERKDPQKWEVLTFLHETSPVGVFPDCVSTFHGRKLISPSKLFQDHMFIIDIFHHVVRNMTLRKVYQLALILSWETWGNVFFFSCQPFAYLKSETIKISLFGGFWVSRHHCCPPRPPHTLPRLSASLLSRDVIQKWMHCSECGLTTREGKGSHVLHLFFF